MSSHLNFTKEGLPVVSLNKYFTGNDEEKQNIVQSVADACQTVGCFFIADHGIDWQIVEDCSRDMLAFFKLPVEEKVDYISFDDANQTDRGYIPYESQNVNAFMGRGDLPNDPVEKFAFGPNIPSSFDERYIKPGYFLQAWAPNIFPENPETTKRNVERYIASVTTLAENLMQIFSLALKCPEDFVYRHCNVGAHSFKVNYYPKVDQPKPNQDRFAEHTDLTPFTIVCPDETLNALMVRNVEGKWVYANAPPKTFFINLGDSMARWTNDKWVATPHKVVFPQEGDIMTDRLSFVFFVLMNHDAIMECLPSCLDENGCAKYEPTSYQDYVSAKMKNLMNAKLY